MAFIRSSEEEKKTARSQMRSIYYPENALKDLFTYKEVGEGRNPGSSVTLGAGRAMRPLSPMESEEMEFLVNLHDPVRFR
ncbi:hypothetical protein EYF80_010101 [Liparis tanakae]|uniref:Uncharacterized protein n=1 Tax=Liparis tanakae TaxID=230148 RepID=A0A4Z2IPK4_9TELE|nr:hypothetical protein EYF80_010101 [Liparis tanakae]